MIPKEGTQVTALPFGSREILTPEQLLDWEPYQGPTDPVTGPLDILHVPADYDFNSPAYTLYLVENTSVDPDTIKELETVKASSEIETFANDCHEANSGRFCEKHGTVGTIFPEDIKVAINNTLDRLNAEWGIGVSFKITPDLPDGASAYVFLDDPQTIHLDPDFPETSSQFLDDDRFLARSVEDVIIHEYGHSLSFTLNKKDEALTDKILQYFNIKDARNVLEREISWYAGRNVTEAIAEAFLQHEQGTSTNWSRSVIKTLERGLK